MPKQKYWDGTAWQEVGASGNKVTISDSGNLITATNAEDALQELITKINTNTNNISNLPKIFTATGTATAILVTTGYFNLVNNQTFTFKASANNNGSATTINADVKGAKSVYKPNTTTPPTFIAGKAYTVWYDTTNVCFFIKASAEGTAVVGDVLAGTTFSNDNDTGLAGTLALTGTASSSDVLANKTFYNTNAKSKQTGGIPIKSAATITPSTIAQTIAAGQYLDGVQTIASLGGNASAPEVLEGNTFSSDSAGRAIAGTMIEQGTQTSTIEITGSAKPTKSIAAGHINASVITAQLSASLASSIVNTAIVGGVQGTAVPLTTEKKVASRTFNITTVSNDLTQGFTISTGLAFNPSWIFVDIGYIHGASNDYTLSGIFSLVWNGTSYTLHNVSAEYEGDDFLSISSASFNRDTKQLYFMLESLAYTKVQTQTCTWYAIE